MMRNVYIGLATMVGISGCADPKPITVERAMAQCTDRARSAVKPDVNVGVGVGIGKRVSTGVGIGIELSSDYLKGRDPEDVYEECVVAKSGEKPTQPLTL